MNDAASQVSKVSRTKRLKMNDTSTEKLSASQISSQRGRLPGRSATAKSGMKKTVSKGKFLICGKTQFRFK
jgi:hypothetical protein